VQAFLIDSDQKRRTGTNIGGLSRSCVARLSCTDAQLQACILSRERSLE
jgi:hypothetical protein